MHQCSWKRMCMCENVFEFKERNYGRHWLGSCINFHSLAWLEPWSIVSHCSWTTAHRHSPILNHSQGTRTYYKRMHKTNKNIIKVSQVKDCFTSIFNDYWFLFHNFVHISILAKNGLKGHFNQQSRMSLAVNHSRVALARWLRTRILL